MVEINSFHSSQAQSSVEVKESPGEPLAGEQPPSVGSSAVEQPPTVGSSAKGSIELEVEQQGKFQT